MRKIPNILCPHGCGRQVAFRFKNGNYCCESNIAKCPAVRIKNSTAHKQIIGWHHSEETKAKMGQSHLGKIISEETKLKLRKPKSEEHRAKLRVPKSAAHKEKLKQANIEAWKRLKTEGGSALIAMQKSWFKKGNVPSIAGVGHANEAKEKIRQAALGRKLSDETKQKIRAKHIGSKRSFETRMKISLSAIGPNSSQWKGGISCEPYCELWRDKDFKKMIKDRDNHECQNSNCWHTDKRLTIHHIDYDKKHCEPINLITLCSSCNTRANAKRDYWKDYYSNIIQQKSL